MKITGLIHAIRIPFKIQAAPGKTLERFVYSYLILGKRIFLIDCGVASSRDVIFDYIRETGRDPLEISAAIITHAHPDHMGGASAIKEETGCGIICHEEDAAWIEDVDRQYMERPVPGFRSLVEGPVKVDLRVKDGDILKFDDGNTLRIIHTPGHSKGHISLVCEEDDALFCGDVIPVPASLPIYEDALASVRSIRKLMALSGLKALCPAWDEPLFGERIYSAMADGIGYIRQIHDLVTAEKAAAPYATATELAARVLRGLGLPVTPLPPIVVRSFESHLQLDTPALSGE